MDHQDRFIKVVNLLKPYQKIWQNEILHSYPYATSAYTVEWIEEISAIKDPEVLLKLERKDFKNIIKNQTLYNLYQSAQELTSFPVYEPKNPLPTNWTTFLQMILKKQYEIKMMAPFVAEHAQDKKIIDIGGGVGFLAQTLAWSYNLPVTSFDQEKKFQDSGHQRQLSYAPSKAHFVNYIHSKIDEHNEQFLSTLNEQTLTTGLHTCGDLASTQIKLSLKKQSSLINLACCYFKMTANEFNLSTFAKNHGLESFSTFALTLASRGHQKISSVDFIKKRKVKFYRYAFHMYFYDILNKTEYLTLGNSSEKLYDLSFALYAEEQFKRLKLPFPGFDSLESFYSSPETQKKILQMLSAGILRDLFGRVLETYIVLDRALFLEENNYHSEILALFSEEISPRNLALVGKSKSV